MSKSYRDIIADTSANLAKLRKDCPEVMQAFSGLAQAATKPGVLDLKTRELIAMALAVAARCDPGATRAEVEEMLGMCVYMGGGPSLMYAAAALAAYEEFGGEKAST